MGGEVKLAKCGQGALAKVSGAERDDTKNGGFIGGHIEFAYSRLVGMQLSIVEPIERRFRCP